MLILLLRIGFAIVPAFINLVRTGLAI